MKIFIVEDDPLFARKFQFEIESTRVHDVHIFNSAERAIGQLSTIQPDIVFIDHFLSGMNGTELISVIKDKLPNCQVVVVSAQSDIAIFEKAMADGARKYIIKDDNFPQNLAKFFSQLKKEEKVETTLEKLSKLFASSPKKNKKPLVFLVDDDEVFNFLVQYKIEELKNCQLEIFIDGTSAINKAEMKPDILLLDYNLKKLNGELVIERFKELSPETKIIMVSSQTDLSIAVRLLDIGAVGYVSKGEGVLDNLKRELTKVMSS